MCPAVAQSPGSNRPNLRGGGNINNVPEEFQKGICKILAEKSTWMNKTELVAAIMSQLRKDGSEYKTKMGPELDPWLDAMVGARMIEINSNWQYKLTPPPQESSTA